MPDSECTARLLVFACNKDLHVFACNEDLHVFACNKDLHVFACNKDLHVFAHTARSAGPPSGNEGNTPQWKSRIWVAVGHRGRDVDRVPLRLDEPRQGLRQGL